MASFMELHDEEETKCTPPPQRLPPPLDTAPQPPGGPDPWDQELRLFAPNWSNPTTQTHLNKRIARPPSSVLPRDRLSDVAERRANQWLMEAERMDLMNEACTRYPSSRRGRPRQFQRAARRLSSLPANATVEPSISTPEQTMALESAPHG